MVITVFLVCEKTVNAATLSQNNDGEYCINSAEDYYTFIDDVYNDETFADKRIVLTQNIKVEAKDRTGTKLFCGSFDGKNHEIDFTNNGCDKSRTVLPFNIRDNASISNLKINVHENLLVSKSSNVTFTHSVLTNSLQDSTLSNIEFYGERVLVYDKAGQTVNLAAFPLGRNNQISNISIGFIYDYNKSDSLSEEQFKESLSSSPWYISIGAVGAPSLTVSGTTFKNCFSYSSISSNIMDLATLINENKDPTFRQGIIFQNVFAKEGTVTTENIFFDKEKALDGVIGTDELIELANTWKLSIEDSFGRTTDEMKLQDTYTGFDFDEIWGISDKLNDGYPFIVAEDVKTVKKLIADLPTQITDADKDAVKAAKDAYDGLTDDQKLQLSADIVQKLNDAVKAIEKEDEPDQKDQEKKSETQKLKKGTKFTVGANKYQVTGDNTATFIGAKNKKVKKISVPASVTYKKQTFKVTAIGPKACKGYKKLSTFVVGKNVTAIGAQAFANTPKLKKIKVQSLVLKKVGAKACKGMHKKGVIKVPKKMLKKYKKLFKGKGQKKTVKIK